MGAMLVAHSGRIVMGEDELTALTPPWAAHEAESRAPKGEGTNGLDYFISYAHPDLETARWIAGELRAAGSTVRYQEEDFEPGGEFRRDIDAAIREARRVIAIVSQASMGSKWCQEEWDAAGDKIVPIRIENADVGGLLGNRTFVDLFGRGMDDAGRRSVLLQAIAGKQPAKVDRRELKADIDLPSRQSPFRGRETLIDDIYRLLHQPGSRPEPRRLTLVGIGGVGKTVLAVEYGHRMRDYDKYEHIWFLRTEKAEALETQLQALVTEVQVPYSSRPLAEQVRRVLNRERDWLVIFDNAPDLQSVIDYLPAAAQGHVLITSENPATWGRANVLEVPGWSLDEAVSFLTEEVETSDRTAAEALAEELEGNPEALTQAVSYMDRTGISIARYLEVHRSRRGYEDDKFAATLALAIDQVANKPLAVDVLRFASFLAPERIPVELLLEGLRSAEARIDALRFDTEAVEPLRRFSLARREDPYLSFSRLVQAQVRASVEQRGETVRWIEAALRALDRLFPKTDELVDPAVWSRAAELLPHALAATDHAHAAGLGLAVVGRLLCRAGRYVDTGARLNPVRAAAPSDSVSREGMHRPARSIPVGGETLTAVTLLEDARRILTEAPDADPLDVAEATSELGGFHRDRNHLDEAIRLFTEAYEIAERAAGRDSVVTCMRLIQLARAERDAGQLKAACTKLEEAVQIAEAARSEGRRVLCEALASLGIARSLQGRYREAVELQRRSVALQEVLWGADHIEVAITLGGLGEAMGGYGDLDGAQTVFDRKIGIERQAYGDQSPARCDGLYAAAEAAINANDPARAERLAAEILELLGDEPLDGDAMASLAYTIRAYAHRLQGSVEWRSLLAEASRALSAANLPDIWPRLNMVNFLVQDGEAATAAKLADEVVQECIKASDWPDMAQAALSESASHMEGGQLKRAETRLRSLIEMLELNTAINESVGIAARLMLGDALRTLGRLDDAVATYQAADRIAKERGDVSSQAVARLGLGDCLVALDRFDEAIAILREALDLRQANLISGHELVVEALLALARAEGASGNGAKTGKQLDAAVAATAARAGARSASVGRVYIRVAESLAYVGRNLEAVSRAEAGLSVLREASGDTRELLMATTDVGFLMLDLEELDKATEMSAAAVELLHRGTALEGEARARVSELAARVAMATGQFGKAKEIVDELAGWMGRISGISPRLMTALWLLIADVAEGTDPQQALDAAEKALILDVDAQRHVVVLRAADLNSRIGRNEKAMRLVEELLAVTNDESIRLSALSIAVPAALNVGKEQEAARLVVEASPLADKERDLLHRSAHRTWIAGAHRRLGNNETAVAILRVVFDDLREHADADQPANARRAAELQEGLADEFSAAGDQAGEITALEQAYELYLRSGDQAGTADVMIKLADATIRAGGGPEASRRWLEQVQRQLPMLKADLRTAIVQLNLGLRYLDLDDTQMGRDALEHALAQYKTIRGENAADASYFLVPLIRVYYAMGEFELARQHADQALACNLIDDDWDPAFLDAIVELAGEFADRDQEFDYLADLARRLGERRLTTAGRAELLERLAYFRSEAKGWQDDRAFDLMEAAGRELESQPDPPAALQVELAMLRADAHLARNDSARAVATLGSTAESLRTANEGKAYFQVLVRLGDLHLTLDAPADAAACFGKAKSLLNQLDILLPDRLDLHTSLAQAHLRAGSRGEGVAELRLAVRLVQVEKPPVEVSTVKAMCRLASALFQDADDRGRASDVLRRAETLNAMLLDSENPQTGGLPALISVMDDLRGVEATLATLKSALRKAPSGSGAFEALRDLVVHGDLTAGDTLDLVISSEEPEVIASTTSILTNAFLFVERADDARAVLRRAIHRLQSSDHTAAALPELDLLLWLSELDEADDPAKAQTALEQALTLAREHPDLQGRIPDVQTRLGLVLCRTGSWKRAVELLAAVEPPAEYRADAELSLAMGRVFTRQYSDALDALNALAAERSDPWPLYFLALAESGTGQYQAAFDSIAQALLRPGALPELLMLSADICNQIAEYEASIRYAKAALEAEPDNASAYQAIGWALQHLGPTRGMECEEAFQKAIDLTNDDNELLYALKGRAGARRAQGREADARADYQQVLERLKPGSDPWLEGWVRYNLGEYDRAVTAFERALADDEDRIGAQFDLALCQAVAGNANAIEAYRTALAELSRREPRRRLAPLRVARNDLRDAQHVHGRLEQDQSFQTIVADVVDALERTEALVVRPIFPKIPPPEPREGS